jgi:hypothetical protein
MIVPRALSARLRATKDAAVRTRVRRHASPCAMHRA